MKQRQRHRGMHPQDAKLFAPEMVPRLRDAVGDLSFLLTRGYAQDAALKVVGDHYQLTARQRKASLRASCSDQSLAQRNAHRLASGELRGRTLAADGYNLIITVESMLSGGVLLRCRDGCVRDMASVHGSYRRVAETDAAIVLLGESLAALGVAHVHWFLDAPVSNSGRLRAMMLEKAVEAGWPWEVELANKVDQQLAASEEVVATADGWILDRAAAWADLMEPALARFGPPANLFDLRPPSK